VTGVSVRDLNWWRAWQSQPVCGMDHEFCLAHQVSVDVSAQLSRALQPEVFVPTPRASSSTQNYSFVPVNQIKSDQISLFISFYCSNKYKYMEAVDMT